MRKICVCLFLVIAVSMPSGSAIAAQIAGELLSRRWSGKWITRAGSAERDAVVLHFRKVLELREAPQHFVVHVSGDNRFVLYVNQQRVGTGPARSDVAHWRFETYDLGPLLRSGRNIVAATVWSFGTRSAVAQMSERAAFLLQGDTNAERVADSNESWEVEEETGISALKELSDLPERFYFAADPGERIDAAAVDWRWNAEASGKDRSRWKEAALIGEGAPRGIRDPSTSWQLVADPLPPMAMELVPAGKAVRASGIEAPTDFPNRAFRVPAHAKASVLMDASHLITAYPELTVSGGAGATVGLTYAEALFDERGNKGNRNDIAGKRIGGLRDEFVVDGAIGRTFQPLEWRTWRFLELDVRTADQPIEIEGLRAWFTAYPFEQRGQFTSDDPALSSIWEIGWRTARLDAHDTYMDTPYWERLQYVGDTRIQALISYTVAGDDRLARQAIQAFNDSRIPDGITQSRYPSSLPQYIPTFSLLFVGMVHDFWFYRGDAEFVRAQLPGTRTVLDWFVRHQRSDGLIGRLPWWVFVDWAEDFANGEPPQDESGGSAVITLQFVEALRNAAEMEEALGDAHRAAAYREAAQRASEGVQKLCWNESYGLIADTPAQMHFSQHANILAVWLDIVPGARQRTVLAKILAASDAGFKSDGPAPEMSTATYYFRFYLARALEHAGMGNDYGRLLEPWRQMVALGLSTWAEQPEPTRSDSHAWSAHPNFDLLTIVAGIRPGEAGFRWVSIEPHLGALKHVAAKMPHPKGEIRVEYTEKDGTIHGEITLPVGVSGTLVWQGQNYGLHAGEQTVELPSRPDGLGRKPNR